MAAQLHKSVVCCLTEVQIRAVPSAATSREAADSGIYRKVGTQSMQGLIQRFAVCDVDQ